MHRRMSLVGVVALVAAACSTGVPADVASSSSAATAAPGSLTSIAPVSTSIPPASSTTTATTTTTIPDTVSPELTIIDPEDGVPVATRKYEFRGTTEPGATLVAAGRYDVTVADDGSWSMLLVLDRGGNLALFSATDEAGNTTDVQMTVVYEPPFTSPDYWTGRTVVWERSGIGRWASVEGESSMWEQNATSLGGSMTGHVLSITPPTERDPAQPKESFVWVLDGDVIVAAMHLEIAAGLEVSLVCSKAGESSEVRSDLVGEVPVGRRAAQPVRLWRLGETIGPINPSDFVCEA